MHTLDEYFRNCLFFAANALARTVARMAEKEFAGLGLSPSHAFTLMLILEKPGIPQKDIAQALDIKRGSVTGMLKKLAANEMINYEPYGYVTLTAKGKKIAREIQTRHTVLKDFLSRILQIDPDTADQTACRMEHAMNTGTFKRFVEFIDFMDSGGCTEKWKKSLKAGS